MRTLLRALPGRGWDGGCDVRVGERTYRLRRPIEERTAPEGSWTWREATADELGPAPQRVRLREVELHRLSRVGAQIRDGLGAQADVLSLVDGRHGLPRLLGRYDAGGRTMLVTATAAAPTWREVYGPGTAPMDRLTAAAVVTAAAPVCAALAELHRHGYAHRALSPDAIVLLDRHRRGALRDAGMAGFRPLRGEGANGYRTPEQRRGDNWLGPGTDVYQFAALIYHTLTGRPAGPAPCQPVRAVLAEFPEAADELLAAALEPDPRRRPRGLGGLARALSEARAHLVAGPAARR
jgi:hypothetical protein